MKLRNVHIESGWTVLQKCFPCKFGSLITTVHHGLTKKEKRNFCSLQIDEPFVFFALACASSGSNSNIASQTANSSLHSALTHSLHALLPPWICVSHLMAHHTVHRLGEWHGSIPTTPLQGVRRKRCRDHPDFDKAKWLGKLSNFDEHILGTPGRATRRDQSCGDPGAQDGLAN